MKEIAIGRSTLGPNQPAFLVAELSGNHGGSLERAIETIHAAKEAGADAIKLQTYTGDTITLNSDKPDFKIPSESPWAHYKTLHALYESASTPWDWHEKLFEEARKVGLEIFSSPFDLSAVEFLENLGTPAYKIASPEITDLALIRACARKGKPLILSTGLSEWEDLDLASHVLREENCENFIFLKCTSAYPAPLEEANLRSMVTIGERYKCLVGLSDHTLDQIAPLGARALGACLIEKHLTLDKKVETTDSFFSLSPNEFREMVQAVRQIESALGSSEFKASSSSKKNWFNRRSLYIAKPIKAGERLGRDHVRSVRPSHGAHPQHLEELLGKRALKDLERGDRLEDGAVE